MAELEALSNKELRKKCMEFNMPDVPVTDSSRKILIRRLEAAMSGKPITTTPAKNNRRETMHVSKPTEVASSPKITNKTNTATKPAVVNRPSRKTIAVPERHVATTTTVSEPEYSDVSPDRVDVNVMAKTKVGPQRHVAITTTVSETEYSDVSPDRGETTFMPKTKTPEKATLYPKLPAKEPSPKPQLLSKTGVVTTSYMQETKAVNKVYADAEEVDSAEEFVQEPINKTISNPPLLSYVPVSEPKVTTTAHLSNLSSNTRYSSLGSYNYNKPTQVSTQNIRKSYAPSSLGYNKLSMQHQYAANYEAEVEDEEDYEDEDDIVLVEESPIKDVETPFLSQFARNLETLKATPIRHSVGPTKITPPKSNVRNRDTYSRRTIANPSSPYNINPRRTLKGNANGEDSSFRQFILAMEEKYHLKHTLILISIFIVAVFIYVFFIQSV